MAKCRTLGIPKTAGIFLLTTQEADHVLSQLRGKPGRPPGPQPWIQEGISRANWYWRGNTQLKQKKKNSRKPNSKRAKPRKENHERNSMRLSSLGGRGSFFFVRQNQNGRVTKYNFFVVIFGLSLIIP